MLFLKAAFWFFLSIIIYSYGIYTIILLIIKFFKNIFTLKKESEPVFFEPEVTLFVAAYNEKECIGQKINNSIQLSYPSEKIRMVWVTDGSNDGSPDMLKNYAGVQVYHQNERKGKVDAMNRGMKMVTTPLVIFSDANTDLNESAVRVIVNAFRDKKVGCVAGEKRIYSNNKEKAVGAGEGLYWQYESLIKKLESDINSTVGAAGELFAVRTELFEDVESDTILDDFTISLRIAEKGYKIKYVPGANAYEKASLSINEELKRKIRIASGGFQTLFRMTGLFNFFKHGLLSFQYISHKVLRWALVPVAFLMIFILNLSIVVISPFGYSFYSIVFAIQIIFYLFVLTGWLLSNKSIRMKIIFVPYYLFVMNYSILVGMIRYFRKKHSVVWEKAKRS